jgi:hypothetical protein
MADSASAQRERGELRIEVRDPQGASLGAAAEIISQANQFRRAFQVEAGGRCVAQDIPFGVYHLNLASEGFAPWSELVEIRSEVPVRISVTLGVATVTTQVQVTDAATLVDPYRTGTLASIGRQSISETISAQPGRTLLSLVNEQPGWLFEANGTLHPRGSEYDVQFVVDGLPLTENRSPAFAPEFDADEIESMRVLTASFPAEYGRKLGGVVELTTQKDLLAGTASWLPKAEAFQPPAVRRQSAISRAKIAIPRASADSTPAAISTLRSSRIIRTARMARGFPPPTSATSPTAIACASPSHTTKCAF